MRKINIIDLSSNDDWQLAWQKLNYNFKNIISHIELLGSGELSMGSAFDKIIASTFDKIYPIGSIIVTESPSDPRLIAGTWTEIMQGKFPIGADTDHPVGTTGGSNSVMLKPTDIPNHEHMVPGLDAAVATGTGTIIFAASSDGVPAVQTDTTDHTQTAIDIEPTYYAVHWFKRVS